MVRQYRRITCNRSSYSTLGPRAADRLAAVNRTVIAIALMLTLLWQSFGLARADSTGEALADREHAAFHWQDEGHHHHDDGAYHVEDSSDSVRHLLADHVTAPLGLLLGTATSFPPTGSVRPGTELRSWPPHPDPDGLFRPPRLSA